MGNTNESTSSAVKTRKARSNEAVAVEQKGTSIVSRLLRKILKVLPPSDDKKTRADADGILIRSRKGVLDAETYESVDSGRITRSKPATTSTTCNRSQSSKLRSKKRQLDTETKGNEDDIRITRSQARLITTKDRHELNFDGFQSTELRCKKPKLDIEVDDIEEDTRETRSRATATTSKNDLNVLNSERTAEVTPTSLSTSFRNTTSEFKEPSLSRPRTRSQVVSATAISSPVRVRPSLGKWKGPALTAHVDTQHAFNSFLLGDTDISTETEENMNTEQMHSTIKFFDNLPEENVMYCLSAAELVSDYENRAKQNEMIEKVNFGNTIESAMNAIQRKLKELEKYEVVEDTDVEDDIREFKKSLKALAALRESECLVRFREMEQDKELQMRQLKLGLQAGVTPIQLEVSAMCDRKIWWVVEKEWLKGSERPCMFGPKCALCLRKHTTKKSIVSNNSITPGVFKMPSVIAFNPEDHEDRKKGTVKDNEARRYNIRSIDLQKKASLTRSELQRLQASLCFVDHYNRTGGHFLPE